MPISKSENAYADARLKPIKPLVDELATELKARSAHADAGVPTLINGYLYERRFGEGNAVPLIVRRRAARGADEEIVLDVGVLAARHPQQCQFGAWAVSPDNTRVAFTVDFSGDREFRIFVRAIAGGAIVDQGIDSAASSIVFAADNRTLFYVRNEPQTLRSYQVWRHRIGSAAGNDVLVYEERDPTFSVSLDLSKSRRIHPARPRRRAMAGNSATCPSISRPGNSGSSSRAGAASSTRPTMSATNSSSAPISTRPTSG